jgi:transposase
MARTGSELPTDVEALQQLVVEQQERIRLLEEWNRLLKAQKFGSRSEKTPSEQARLFNEAELEAVRAEDDATPELEVPSHTRRRPGRRPLPDFLPVEEIVHDVPEAERVCRNDPDHEMVEIGRESTDRLRFIPAHAEIERHIRPKYACRTCKEGVVVAPPPSSPIPKSLATPSLLAHVATSKYVDALPLYRQEKIFGRLGIDLSRATLASWMVRMGEMVEPLVERLRDAIRAGPLVLADETPFQVLKEPGKRAQSLSYLWALWGGSTEHPLIVYAYDPSRSAEVPKRLLRGFQGYLLTDGYEGYTALGQEPGIVHAGCWAHARRKFDEALRGQPRTKKKGARRPAKESKARQALSQIQGRHAVRQERSRPLVEKLRAWLDASKDSVPPQSLTGKAMAYMDRQWPKLVRFLEDGCIPLDTNRVENAIRPFVVGRKNWLFADTVGGARASANLYGLIETAKANGIEPWRYLEHVFDRLPRMTLPEQVDALLPQNVDLATLRSR